MITAKEREQKFRKELQELLDRHGAEMDVKEDPYSNRMDPQYVCMVSMSSVWNGIYAEKDFCEFDLRL